jgi:hypothetical protein
LEPSWKRDCWLDLQGELEKMEMKKFLEFIGSCIPFLFSNGQNWIMTSIPHRS